MARATNAEDFLAHYGVKGMKWGRRKDNDGPSLSDRLRGGPKEPDSMDSTKAKHLQKRVGRSGTDALSNRELQELVTRMNLEQQYNRLTPKKTNAGADFIKKLGQQALQREVQAVMKGDKGPLYSAVETAMKMAKG